MSRSEVYACQCKHRQQQRPHPDQDLHRQMNLLLSRLDEQQRRWYVAVESNRIGAGGDRQLSQITVCWLLEISVLKEEGEEQGFPPCSTCG
jgi:hypothetical protein